MPVSFGSAEGNKKKFASLDAGGYDAFEDLARSGTESVLIQVQRRNANGTFNTLPGKTDIAVSEISGWEDAIYDRAGGGDYRCAVFHPLAPTKLLFEFGVKLEGPPKIPQRAQPGLPTGMTPPSDVTQRYLANMTPGERAAYLQAQQQQHSAPGAMYASDQVLASVAERQERELAEIRAQREAEAKEIAAERERLRKELDALREQAREATYEGKIAAMQAEIRAMREHKAEPKPPSIFEQLTPVLPALVPFGVAWLESRAKTESTQMSSQQALMTALLTQATAPKPDSTKELLTTLSPVVLPLLSKALDRNAPEAQAALFSQMAQNNLQSISMMTQLVESLAPPPESAAGQMIRSALEGVRDMAVAYATSKGGLPGQAPASPSPIGVLDGAPAYRSMDEAVDAEVTSPAGAGAPPDPSLHTQRRQRQVKPPPPEVVAMFAMLPAEFRTEQWRAILEAMHQDPPADVERVADMLAGHIENLARTNTLPPQMEALYTEPRATLEAGLERLPVAVINPAYVKAVIDRTLALLIEDGWFQTAPAASDAEEDDGEDEDDESDSSAGAEAQAE